MIQVLEAVELFVVALAMGLGFWLVDLIQRKTGHPLFDQIEEE